MHRQAALAPERREAIEGARHQLGQVEGDLVQRRAPGLDLGQVKHVRDDAGQRFRRFHQVLQVLAAAPLVALVLQQARQAEHAVQRRADLVAHRGQEGALGAPGCFGLLPGLGQRSVGVALRAEVQDQPDRASHPRQRRVGRLGTPAHAQDRAVGALHLAFAVERHATPRRSAASHSAMNWSWRTRSGKISAVDFPASAPGAWPKIRSRLAFTRSKRRARTSAKPTEAWSSRASGSRRARPAGCEAPQPPARRPIHCLIAPIRLSPRWACPWAEVVGLASGVGNKQSERHRSGRAGFPARHAMGRLLVR